MTSGLNTLYEAVLHGFEKICSDSLPSANEDILDPDPLTPLLRGRFFEEAGRFRIWAKNVGAHRQGKVSLNHRLREAPHVRSMVVGLLEDIQRFFDQVQSLRRNSSPADEDSDSDSSSPIEEINSSVSSDLTFVLSDLSHAVSALYRLSLLIQNPTSQTKVTKYARVNVSHFEIFEQQRIEDKYRALPSFLTTRLVKANLLRRQQFIYAKSHHDKIAGEEGEPRSAFALRGRPLGAPSQTTATTFYPLKANPTGLLEVIPENESLDGRSIGTATSLAPSCAPQHSGALGREELETENTPASIKTIQISIPPPPKPYDTFTGQPKYFPCPYCYKIIHVTNSHDWKRHVLTDLQPYICTYDSCPDANNLYSTRQHWYDHEVQFHRREWICRQMSCQQRFRDRNSLRAHLRSKHSDVLSKLGMGSANSDCLELLGVEAQCEVDAQLDQKCPFCCVLMSPLLLRSHLGKHLVDIALFALPRGCEEKDAYEEETHPSGEEADKKKEEEIHSSRGNRPHSTSETAPVTETSQKIPTQISPPETYTEHKDTNDPGIQCICGFSHDDGFMIACDRCDTWQHGYCVAIATDNIPEVYECPSCDPCALHMRIAGQLNLYGPQGHQNQIAQEQQQQQSAQCAAQPEVPGETGTDAASSAPVRTPPAGEVDHFSLKQSAQTNRAMRIQRRAERSKRHVADISQYRISTKYGAQRHLGEQTGMLEEEMPKGNPRRMDEEGSPASGGQTMPLEPSNTEVDKPKVESIMTHEYDSEDQVDRFLASLAQKLAIDKRQGSEPHSENPT